MRGRTKKGLVTTARFLAQFIRASACLAIPSMMFHSFRHPLEDSERAGGKGETRARETIK